jgi:hypothetical protein
MQHRNNGIQRNRSRALSNKPKFGEGCRSRHAKEWSTKKIKMKGDANAPF